MSNEMMKEKLDALIPILDNLNDKLYLAVEKQDGKQMDYIGRELISLGQIVKDLGYKVGREVRG